MDARSSSSATAPASSTSRSTRATRTSIYAASWERYRTPVLAQQRRPRLGALEVAPTPATTWTEIKGSGYPEGVKGRIGLADRAEQPERRLRADRRRGRSTPNGPMRIGQRAARERPLSLAPTRGEDVDADEQHQRAPVLLLAGARRPEERRPRLLLVAPSSRCRTTAARRRSNAAQGVHVDDHGIWIDPNDPERWALANDGGIAITFDKGGNFFYPMNLPLAPVLRGQLRHARCRTTSAPARRTTARGAARAASAAGAQNNSYWFTIAGGDGFYTAQDPTDRVGVGRVAERRHAGAQPQDRPDAPRHEADVAGALPPVGGLDRRRARRPARSRRRAAVNSAHRDAARAAEAGLDRR